MRTWMQWCGIGKVFSIFLTLAWTIALVCYHLSFNTCIVPEFFPMLFAHIWFLQSRDCFMYLEGIITKSFPTLLTFIKFLFILSSCIPQMALGKAGAVSAFFTFIQLCGIFLIVKWSVTILNCDRHKRIYLGIVGPVWPGLVLSACAARQTVSSEWSFRTNPLLLIFHPCITGCSQD